MISQLLDTPSRKKVSSGRNSGKNEADTKSQALASYNICAPRFARRLQATHQCNDDTTG